MQLEFDLKASILAFPLARRHEVVLDAARAILTTSDEDAALYWRGLIRSLTDPLLAAGVPRDVVHVEAQNFSAAVQAAVWRMDHQPARPGGRA